MWLKKSIRFGSCWLFFWPSDEKEWLDRDRRLQCLEGRGGFAGGRAEWRALYRSDPYILIAFSAIKI